MIREEARNKTEADSGVGAKKKEEEEKKNMEAKAKGEKEGDDGKLTLSEVGNFPDDVDEIV
jgi:hypothetical protein